MIDCKCRSRLGAITDSPIKLEPLSQRGKDCVVGSGKAIPFDLLICTVIK